VDESASRPIEQLSSQLKAGELKQIYQFLHYIVDKLKLVLKAATSYISKVKKNYLKK